MAIWGGESEDARPGQNQVNNGLYVPELESPILIDSAVFTDLQSFALDVRGRANFNYRINNADLAADGVYQILGTTKDYQNLSDLELADFVQDTVVAEVINFGATLDAQIVLTTPIGNALLTGLLVRFRKVTGDWNLTGILRTK